MENKSDYLNTAIKAAQAAGALLENYFQTELVKEFKEDKSIVTAADKESEEAIKKIILGKFPDHSFFGEETGMTGVGQTENMYIWHVDPLDGTTNFSNGIPIFCISIALEYRGEIITAVMYHPVAHSLFCAEAGNGAYLNDKKISVSESDEKHCTVTASASRKEEDKILARTLLFRLPEKLSAIRALGSSATELSYVARGGLAGIIELGLSTYDFAAGTLLVQEAGGKITKLDGSVWKFPENYFIASNGVFHDLLVEEVKTEKAELGII